MNWPHSDFVVTYGEVDSSTNVSEAVHRGMRHDIPNPPSSVPKLLAALKLFHFGKLNKKREWGKTKSRKRKLSVIYKHDKMRSLINQYHELDKIERQDMLMTQLKNLSDARKDNYHTDYDTLVSSDSEVDSDTE